MIDNFEKSFDKFRQAIGEEEYQRMQKERVKFENKKSDVTIGNIVRKFQETKNKKYLTALEGLGYPLAD